MARHGLGGGGGGGHHHHGGGGGGGWGFPGWRGGGPWYPYYDPGVQLFTIDDREPSTQVAACPKQRRPVLASDGLVYDNACLARAAGVKVVRVAGHDKTPMKGVGAFDLAGMSPLEMGLLAVGGYLLYKHLR
jgi:hypothetical protein